MVPSSVLAFLLYLYLAHPELGLGAKFAFKDPGVVFPQAERGPTRPVLEVASDHAFDIRPPPKLTARVGYQPRQLNSSLNLRRPKLR